MYRKTGGRLLKSCAFAALVIVAVSFVALPLIWMATNSLKPPTELFKSPPTIFIRELYTGWYKEAFQNPQIIKYFSNSFGVAVGTTAIVTLIAVLGAYSLTRFRYPGRKLITVVALAAYCIPPIMLIMPIYGIVAKMGLNGSLLGVIIGHATSTFPFAIWLLTSFFRGIPRDIEESASVGGASDMQIFLHIVLPLTVPGILSTAILVFILSWNEYLFASILVSQDSLKTLTVGLAKYVDSVEIRWGVIMALGTATTIPIVLLFSAIQKYFVEGLTAGSVKG